MDHPLLDVVFSLSGTFADLISALNTGELRLGLHVRSIDFGVTGPTGSTGSSESYVSTVPLPAAVWMLGSALIGLIGFSRRQ